MLVLNATYEPINVCTVRRAVILLLKSKAEVIEHGELTLRSESSVMARPAEAVAVEAAIPPNL